MDKTPALGMTAYRRAVDGFDAVLASVPASGWDKPSACADWTVRDVAGHVAWAQEQFRHWATGEDYDNTAGKPGAPHPGELAGDDPVATWRAARAACDEVLTAEALARTVTLPAVGERPLAALVGLMVTDLLAHTWDIGHAMGQQVVVAPELLPGSLAWARENVVRAPSFFGPELAPPPDAGEQTRWLAYLGRASWEPVPAGDPRRSG